MKFHTPEKLEKGIDIESDAWNLFIDFECTPFEAFDKIPFLTNSQAGKLSEYGTCICSFENEETALEALDKIRKQNGKDKSNIKANLIHDGIFIDSI